MASKKETPRYEMPSAERRMVLAVNERRHGNIFGAHALEDSVIAEVGWEEFKRMIVTFAD